MGKKLLLAGSRSEAAIPTSRSPETWVAGRVLEEAGGIGSAASGLSATRITYKKGRKERTRRRMEGRYLVSHPSRPKGPFFSSSPATLDALLLPCSYLGKRDADPVARKLPKGTGLNQSDSFFSRNPKGLNRERGRQDGLLDLPGFSNRDPLLLPFWDLMGLSLAFLTSSWVAPKLLGLSLLAPWAHVST